jgi:hypothetical protein
LPVFATTDGATASAVSFKTFNTGGSANDAPIHFIAIGLR